MEHLFILAVSLTCFLPANKSRDADLARVWAMWGWLMGSLALAGYGIIARL